MRSRWTPGKYRLVLVTGGYFQEHHDAVFYPTIALQFRLSGDREPAAPDVWEGIAAFV